MRSAARQENEGEPRRSARDQPSVGGGKDRFVLSQRPDSADDEEAADRSGEGQGQQPRRAQKPGAPLLSMPLDEKRDSEGAEGEVADGAGKVKQVACGHIVLASSVMASSSSGVSQRTGASLRYSHGGPSARSAWRLST